MKPNPNRIEHIFIFQTRIEPNYSNIFSNPNRNISKHSCHNNENECVESFKVSRKMIENKSFFLRQKIIIPVKCKRYEKNSISSLYSSTVRKLISVDPQINSPCGTQRVLIFILRIK